MLLVVYFKHDGGCGNCLFEPRPARSLGFMKNVLHSYVQLVFAFGVFNLSTNFS